MPANPSMSHATRLGIVKSETATAATLELEVLSQDVRKVGSQVHNPGMRGTRSHNSEGVADSVDVVSGSITLEPRVDNLTLFSELILGGTVSSGVVAPAEILPAFFLDVDKVFDKYRYGPCKVNTATFRSAPGTPLTLTLAIEGTDETAGITFPSIAGTLSANRPFVHHQLVLTLGGTEYEVADLEIAIDNRLVTDRHLNSRTRAKLPEGDRVVTLACTLPHTADQAALQAIAVGGLTGTNRAKWTDGNTSYQLDFARLQVPYESAAVGSRGQEITRRFAFQARRIGTTAEITATIDATP